jgi:hypothetical protein
MLAIDDIIKAFLHDTGFLYFYEGEYAWHMTYDRDCEVGIETNGV